MSKKSKRDDELQAWIAEADRENRNCNRLENEFREIWEENQALRQEVLELKAKVSDLENQVNELLTEVLLKD